MTGYKFQLFCSFGALFLLLEAKSIKPKEGTEPFQLEEFLQNAFYPRGFNGTWQTDNSFTFPISDGSLFLFDATTKTSTPYLSSSIWANYSNSEVTISNDQLYLVLKYNVSKIFRHSKTASYTIYSIQDGKYYDVAEKAPIQLFDWSPAGHGAAYVLDNNIYYLKTPEDVTNPSAVTTDGVPGIIYNGVPDWVYEEEVLGTGSALWWSRDGTRIAFATFNDTNVAEFDYVHYGKPQELLYPEIRRIRYPKVGTTNPTVKTSLVDLNVPGEIKEIKAIPDRFLPENYVVFGMKWVTENDVVVLSMNRVQNESELVRCGFSGGSCVQEAAYEQEKGWLDGRIPNYNKDGTKRLEILPQAEGDDFYDHLVLTDIPNNVGKRLTQGKFVVTKILGWDETNNVVYFEGSGENGSYTQQHVYSVDTEVVTLSCLTCGMTTLSGDCKVGSAETSKDLTYVAISCEGPGPNFVEIRKTRSVDDVYLWEDNHELMERLAVKLQPVIKDVVVPLDEGFEANARLYLPPDLDENSPQKYPAIVRVYAGPDTNIISDSYSTDIYNYVVTNRKYIYIHIDGRGNGKTGNKKKFQMYRKMGTVEIEDQIAVMKYLQQTYPYIDASNTGIWGWSYGGFATAWVLSQDKERVFKWGLSVAPVTNFILYDSIYTERYMGLATEDDNLAGYNKTDLTRPEAVEGFRGKIFFIVHGNGDDNVHYQQSMLLSKQLELADILFKQQSYPDEDHSLANVSRHLYHTLDQFWAAVFAIPSPPPKQRQSKEKD